MPPKNLIHPKNPIERLLPVTAGVLFQDGAAVNILAWGDVAIPVAKPGFLRRKQGTGRRAKTLPVPDLRARDARAREKITRIGEARRTHSETLLREANARARMMADAAAKLAYAAAHDFLTGLPNRMHLLDRLAQAIALAQRHDNQVALLFLDLDQFKQVNDSFGHDVGDQLLQSAADRLKACVRLSDTVSRHGGDEFVVLLPEVDGVQGAVLAARKLIEVMVEPHLIDNHRLRVTLSIGISLYPDSGKDSQTMLQNADTAMYYAKKSGRNTYRVFTADMNGRSAARQAIRQRLHQALDQHRFVLHYQPRLNLQNGTISGVEALLRWQRSDHLLVRPAQFISIAEGCGLILPIGKWVLGEACRQARSWQQAGFKFDRIAVNISVTEFLCKDFVASVWSILKDTGLEPHHLEIELNESVLAHDRPRTTVILSALKERGVQIAADNFGAGYAGLSNLWSFPIDTIKIDRSIVQNIDGKAGKAVVSAMIAMGASLKQRVVAEGIETRQQLTLLKSHHCVEGQGYYLGRPRAVDKFTELLRTTRSGLGLNTRAHQ